MSLQDEVNPRVRGRFLMNLARFPTELAGVQAADSCASLLFEAPDMPWNFCFDLSRHLWDETQHGRSSNTWIPVLTQKTGEPRSFEQVKEDAVRWRATVLAEVYRPTAGFFRR